jgi:hypothetical protein
MIFKYSVDIYVKLWNDREGIEKVCVLENKTIEGLEENVSAMIPFVSKKFRKHRFYKSKLNYDPIIVISQISEHSRVEVSEERQISIKSISRERKINEILKT